tara:strand:+ start:7 stop:582 length:576 start_codon:yes stop_codon:yes gene_type:complete
MSVTHKKLTLQYAYLKLEKEETDEICSSVEPEIRSYMEEHYPEHYKDFYSPPKTETPKESIEPPEEPEAPAEEKRIPPKNKDLKKLYRKIAEKTHPDKVGNNSHARMFSEASEAYSKNDIATLLNLAGSLNIELLDLSSESLELLENNINTIAMEIYKKKKTIAWAWHESTSPEQKENLIRQVLSNKGIKV